MTDFNKRRILVFDMEVSPYNFDTHYDEDTKKYLTKYAKDEEDGKKIIEQLVFTPFTSFIVSIGLYDLNESRGAVLFNAEEGTEIKSPHDNINYEVSDEAALIKKFWNVLEKKKYNMFVTFNGREFDCPYIMLRSFIHRIRPSYNLMRGTDFNIRDYHIDLMKELTFNKHAASGARRKFSLDFYCKQLGITSPKGGGVTGDMVGELYNKKEYQRIADYCIGDVLATAELYNIWNDNLNLF
ncbi:MAG: ribonuclease H-like domain-containing protein [Ignavibacteriae bacterium]|jgi:hypothetical protein|nr:ribonuclease H-like domain-containing protein [Ignavibacteriota bacterium]